MPCCHRLLLPIQSIGLIPTLARQWADWLWPHDAVRYAAFRHDELDPSLQCCGSFLTICTWENRAGKRSRPVFSPAIMSSLSHFKANFATALTITNALAQPTGGFGLAYLRSTTVGELRKGLNRVLGSNGTENSLKDRVQLRLKLTFPRRQETEVR